MANVQITQLPNAQPLTGTEQVPVVQSGITVKTTVGAIAAAQAPVLDAEYVLLNSNPTFPNSRYLSSDLPIRVTDNGALSDVVISLDPSGVTPGTYTNANITVNSKGIVTSASNGSSPGPTGVTLINTGTGLTGGPITSTGTISIDSTVVTKTGTQLLTNKTISGSNNTLTNIGNSSLVHSSLTINGSSVSLGGSVTVTATASHPLTLGFGLNGGSYNGSSNVTTSVDTTVIATLSTAQTLTNKTISGSSNTLTNIANASLVHSTIGIGSSTIPLGSSLSSFTGVSINASLNTLSNIPNASLTNSSFTINGTPISLGGTATITAAVANPLTIGTGLSGTSYNGSTAVTIAIDSTVATLTGTQTLTNKSMSGSSNTFTNLPNSALTNSSITINGSPVSLGGSISVTAGIDTLTIGTGLTGTSFNGTAPVTIAIDSTVATLTGSQTLTNKTINASNNTLSNIPNAALTNDSITINGSTVALGGSITIGTGGTAYALTIGTGLTGGSFNGSAPVTITIDSSVATLTGVQTLSNKTLTNPTVTNVLEVQGTGTTSITPFANSLAVFEADTNDYQIVYGRNNNSGSDASFDFVAYNDASDVNSYFIDMGMNSSGFSSTTYPIFTPNSGYLFTGGGTTGQQTDLFIGTSNSNSDIYFFTGDVQTSNIRATITGNTGNFIIGTGADTGELFQVYGSTHITGAAQFDSTVLLSADPTTALQAATKQYVDNAVSTGIHIHQQVYVEKDSNLAGVYVQGGTTFNITNITSGRTLTTSVNHGLSINDQIWLYSTAGNGLSLNTPYFVHAVVSPNQIQVSTSYGGPVLTGLTNGSGLSYATRANSGVGAYLEASSNAVLPITVPSGYAPLAVGDRVLIYQQSNPNENGVYVVTDLGSVSSKWKITRASDANRYSPQDTTGLSEGDYFFITTISESYVLTTPGNIIIGYTGITYTLFSAATTYTGTSPINVTGSVISLTTVPATLGGTGTSTVTTGDLLYGSATDTWSKLPLGSAYKSLIVNASGTQVEWNAIPLNQTTAVSGQLSVSNGGSGTSSLTGYLIGNGTSAFTATATIPTTDLSGTISNAQLANSSITINGNSVSLGGSTTVTANTTNSLTFNNSGTGDASGTIFNGSVAHTISYNTLGAPKADGTGASGTWAIDISGNAATATSATSATSATTATNLAGGAANSLPYQTGSGSTSFIGIGSNDQVLTVVSGVPTWQTPGAVSAVTTFSAGTTGFTPNSATSGAVTLAGTLNVANGGTGTTSLTGILYGNGTSAVTSATGSDVVTLIGSTAVTNATNATNSTNATNTGITNDTTTNATVYPTWVTANTGNLPQKVTSTKLTFNPSTGVLTSTGGISGGSF